MSKKQLKSLTYYFIQSEIRHPVPSKIRRDSQQVAGGEKPNYFMQSEMKHPVPSKIRRESQQVAEKNQITLYSLKLDTL